MQNEYENFIEYIDQATSAAVEYETEHEDAGANYASYCLADDMTYNNATERFLKWLELHDITLDKNTADECLEWLAIDCPLETGGMFVPADWFYSTETYVEQPSRFILSSWPVQEVEAHIPLDLKRFPFARAFARKAENDNRVCIRYSPHDDYLLSYEATDAVWTALLDIADVKEWIADNVGAAA